ncbi:MAG: Gfo/Idh/MocA family oxidoreductase [Acidobacteria bacterium]|nr:Gfo/Idh/MocA family oxidoreductase [Acidobacteriota bacterium]
MTKQVVNIGIIGAGFARSTQAPAFAACAGARVAAIASARRGRAEAVAREFGIPFVGDDWRDVVAREDVSLVCVTTPPVFHREMTLAALDAGKAVLCEKPTAMSAAESGEMRRRAQDAGALALVDHELRFVPARRRARELIGAGALGGVRHAKVVFRADSRAETERAWDWWSDAAAGGGALGAIGSHAVDSLRWLAGAEVSEVFCQLATHVAERPDAATGESRRVTTDDEASLLLRLEGGAAVAGGATASVALSFVEAGEPLHRAEIFGERGALRIEGARLWRARAGGHAWEQIETGDAPLAAGMRDNEWSRGFTAFSREIVAALGAGRTAVEGAATFADGHRVQLVLDAARRSHETGKKQGLRTED